MAMRNLALIVVLLVCTAAGNAQTVKAPTVKTGIEAWHSGDYAAAVASWRPLAETGDADAAFNLGQAYRLGRGVPLSLSAAQTWFERAARQGHLDAQATLGLLLFNNGNRVGGLRWLRAAAEQGEPRSLLVYGTALFNGDGVVRDPVLAYAYVSRAAAQGLAPARATLAQMDKLIPLEQRRKGLARAQEMTKKAKVEPPPTAKPVATPAPKLTAKPTVPTQAPARTAAAGPWRVQLGAFSKRESAEALFRRLAGSGALAGRRPFYVAAGPVTRLQAGPFASRAAAAAACAALSATGQPCFPVAAK